MATYSVVLFYAESDDTQQQYMTEQQSAIQKAHPALSVEVVSSTDSRLSLYGKYPDRTPCILILKNGARMQARHSKLSHTEATTWITSIIT